MTRAWFPLLLALAAPPVARGETIYAVWVAPLSPTEFSLLRFDSATPEVIEREVPLHGDLEAYSEASLEFDPTDGTLYAFAYLQCQVLCPYEPVTPVILDPETGDSSFANWPGLPTMENHGSDKDIHPLTRELRFLGLWDQNFRYSIEDLELYVDHPISNPGGSYALAHTPPGVHEAGVETFAVGYPAEPGEVLYLMRIGGPGDAPSASSGEVHLIGPMAAIGEVRGFDISFAGTAYFATVELVQGSGYVNRLYTVDLEGGAVQELGVIAVENPWGRITGIAVALPGPGASILEIPALSRLGLATFALAVAGLALWRFRARPHLLAR